jgi:hypothetical protein
MPRNASGTYSLPAGNPVVSGTTISSTWANNTLNDIALEMTDSLSRSGEGAMLAPLELVDGTESAPALTWDTEPTTGWYRAGAGDIRFSVSGSDVLIITSAGIAGAVTPASPLVLTSTAPILDLVESDAAVDNKRWRLTATSEGLDLQTVNDANDTVVDIITIERTGTVVDSFRLDATNITIDAVQDIALIGGDDIVLNAADDIQLICIGRLSFEDLTDVLSEGSIYIQNNAPFLEFDDQNATANEQRWRWAAAGTEFALQLYNDAGTLGDEAILFTRSSNSSSSIHLWSNNLYYTYDNSDIRYLTIIDHDTATVTLTGVSGTPTDTCQITRWCIASGSSGVTMVTLCIDSQFTGTSNTTVMTITGVPSEYAPNIGSGARVPCCVIDNNVEYVGACNVNASGTISFSIDAGSGLSTGAFTASGVKGTPTGWTITYCERNS